MYASHDQSIALLKRLVLLTVLVFTVDACGSSNSAVPSTPTSATSNPYSTTHLALCNSLRLAADEELVSARKTFIDDAHNALHDLARDVADVDRSVSARLLEAKQQVEADFSVLDPDVAADLDQLINRVRTAIVSLDQTPPPSCN